VPGAREFPQILSHFGPRTSLGFRLAKRGDTRGEETRLTRAFLSFHFRGPARKSSFLCRAETSAARAKIFPCDSGSFRSKSPAISHISPNFVCLHFAQQAAPYPFPYLPERLVSLGVHAWFITFTNASFKTPYNNVPRIRKLSQVLDFTVFTPTYARKQLASYPPGNWVMSIRGRSPSHHFPVLLRVSRSNQTISDIHFTPDFPGFHAISRPPEFFTKRHEHESRTRHFIHSVAKTFLSCRLQTVYKPPLNRVV